MSDNLVGIKRIQHYSYVLNEEIGRGYSSNVYKGKDDRTNQLVAVKVVNHKKLEDQFHRDLLQQEIACLKQIKNEENILKLLDVYSTPNNTYIITELCDNKDLSKLIKSKGKLSQEETIGIMKQLIKGTLNMQKHRIIHRDLKPANIFFKNGILKIADFGFAYKEGTPVQKYNLGSPSYMAPQVLRDNKYSFKSDIWALGVIMYQMLHGKVPWQSNTQMILLAFITQQAIQTVIRQDLKNKPIIVNFLKKSCNPIFESRMSSQQLVHYDWGQKKGVNESIVLNIQHPNTSRNTHLQSNIVPDGNNQFPQIPQIPQVNTVNHISTIPSNATQRQHHRSEVRTNNNIPPISMNTQSSNLGQVIINQQIHHQHSNKSSSRQLHNLSKSDDGISSVALDAIISQIHYCRFGMMIISNIEKMQESEIKRDLWQYFANQIVQKIGLLHTMASSQQNILQLDGFRSLLRLSDWVLIKQTIAKYRNRYIRYLNRQNADYNSEQSTISKSIKFLASGIIHMPLLQQLVIFYQIKLLQKKIDYNEFGAASKIQNVVSAMELDQKPEISRLKQKIALLGLN